MSNQKPPVDRDTCLKTADQCCQYYADVLANFADCRIAPVWQEMQRVAEEWRTLLNTADPSEAQFADLESQVLAKWDAHCGHTKWIWMATCIDIWLRSLGRKGLGPN